MSNDGWLEYYMKAVMMGRNVANNNSEITGCLTLHLFPCVGRVAWLQRLLFKQIFMKFQRAVLNKNPINIKIA